MVPPAEGYPHPLQAPKPRRDDTHRPAARGCGHGRSFHDAHDACSAWILDEVPDGILSIDQHGRVLSVNRQIERLFGYRREELVGQSINKLFSVWPETPGGVSQVTGHHSDGSTLPFDVRLGPACTAHRVRTVLVAAASTRATGELRDLARDILEAAADPIWVVDALALRLTYANGGLLRRLGYDDYEVLGRPIGFIAPGLADGGFGRRLAQLGRGTPSSLVHPTFLRCSDGVDVAVEVRAQALSAAGDGVDRGPSAYVSIARELRTRAGTEAAPRRADTDPRLVADPP
jgi:PAS domain S-box-containing protein